jgi:hypothetical protein
MIFAHFFHFRYASFLRCYIDIYFHQPLSLSLAFRHAFISPLPLRFHSLPRRH